MVVDSGATRGKLGGGILVFLFDVLWLGQGVTIDVYS